MDIIHSKTTKESLIADIKRRQEDKIIEESNAKLLIKLIENAEDLNEAINIAALGTTYKRTGFHFDKRLEKMGSDIKYFKKNEKLSFVEESTKSPITHKLIIGDNYDALQNLLIEYKGKIDVIYIDPPYGKDSMGEFAETNYDNAITRDNLLSMLYNRLILAKELMSDDGVIFCSIDDRNQAYVKCLFDEVFGERNFVGCAPRKTNDIIRQNSDSQLQSIFDYVLVYKKDFTVFLKEITNIKKYPYKDEKGEYFLSPFQNSGPNSTRKARPNEYYPIYINDDSTLTLEKKNKNSKEIWPKPSSGEDGRWLWSKEKFLKDNNLLYFDGDTIKKKRYKGEFFDDNVYQTYKLWLDGKVLKNNQGTVLLTSILKRGIFKNPKPIELIKWLVNLHPNKSATVLDFFAGSGTTGQAVLELNKEDDGNRQFILCTNNEKTETTPNGIAIDVTSKRLKRVMTGKCYDGTSDFDWIKKNEPLGGSLDVYDIAQVFNYERSKGKSAFDVIDETLYGKEKFTDANDKIKWVCENFEHTQKYLEEK